jgi:tRNA-dihydrouridine synthase
VSDPPRSAYQARYTKPELVRESEVYNGYQYDAVRDRLPPLNTHSDEFGYWQARGYGGYGHAYSKTATMLYNLQYVVGDSLFLSAMRHFAQQLRAEGVPLHAMTRHLLGLFQGRRGARAWRRHLASEGVKRGAGLEVLRQALAQVDREWPALRAHAAA